MKAAEGPRLTVRDRILVHLADFASAEREAQAPLDITQAGLARAVGIQQRHAPQYVRPLMAQGLVVERVRHVRGGRQRKKAYFLTQGGRVEAARLRGNILGQVLEVEDQEGRRQSLTLAKAMKEHFSGVALLEILRILEPGGVVRIAGRGVMGDRPESLPLIERTSGAPRVEGFLGRQKELDMLIGESGPRILVVRGVAGIGKSSLGARACELLRGKKNLFWYRLRPWDTRQSVLTALANFLSALGRPGLRSVTARGEADRAPEVLGQDLPGTLSLLVFDDAHEAGAEVLSLFRFLKEALVGAQDVRVLLLTRRTLPFYDRRDVVLERLVAEMDLKGLNLDEVGPFLSSQMGPKTLAKFYRDHGGHPLFLQLIRSSPGVVQAVEARRDMRRFVEEAVYSELSDVQRKMMKVASLYKVPVPREALFLDKAASHDVLLSLVDRSLIVPVGGDNFEVHDTIQEFFTTILSEEERRELGSFSARQLSRLASGAYSQGNFVGCINYLSNALQLTPPPKEVGALQEQLGDAYERIGDLPATLVAYKEAARTTKRPEVLARLHRKTAFALQARKEIGAAVAEVEAAQLALASLDEAVSPERGWLSLVQCRINIDLEQWKDAREHGEGALQTFRMLNLVPGQAQALLALGEIEIDSPRGDPRLAERHFVAALDLSAAIQDEAFAAKVLTALARLYIYRFGDIGKAAKHVSDIEQLPKAMEDPQVRQSLLTLKGWVSLELDMDYAAAEEYFKGAMALARKIHDGQGVVSARYALAEVWYFQGRLDEARPEFERCAAEWIQQGLLGQAVECLWVVAECCLVMGDPEGFRRAVAVYRDPKLVKGLEARPVYAKVFLGFDRLLQGDIQGFHSAFSEALSFAEQGFAVQDWSLTPFVLWFYGDALRAIGKHEEGTEMVRRATELGQARGLRAKVHQGTNYEDRAVESIRQAAKIS